MASYFQPIIVLFALVSGGLTASMRQKRQADGFICPQPTGQFEFPGDCTRYYECSNGQATLVSCTPQLIFNAQEGFCDWPFRVPNPNCQPGGSGVLTINLQGICDRDPYGGEPQNAFQVAHPDLCNAFYTCSTSFLYEAPCTFCPQGMFFDESVGSCRDFLSTGQSTDVLCNGKQFIDHADKVFRQIDGTCWPYANRPNPWQEAAVLLASGSGLGGGPPPTQGGAPAGF